MPAKMKNVLTKQDGYTFGSKLEEQRYEILKERQEKGDISELKVHPIHTIFVNGAKMCKMIPDFSYRKLETHTERRRVPHFQEMAGIMQEVWYEDDCPIRVSVECIEDVKGRQSGPAYDMFTLKKKLLEATTHLRIIEITRKNLHS